MVHDEDGYFDERVAARYDESSAEMFEPAVVDPAVRLPRRAGRRADARSSWGSGRAGSPCRSLRGECRYTGSSCRTRWPPGCARSRAARTSASRSGTSPRRPVEGTFTVAYLVFNTIMNLTTQAQQVQCFRNVAAHLEPGGCFVDRGRRPGPSTPPAGRDHPRRSTSSETRWGIRRVRRRQPGPRLPSLRARRRKTLERDSILSATPGPPSST